MQKKIAIIGAGASGMVCAIMAAKSTKNRITIFDKNVKAGRKITITGNGRCNITNRTITPQNYHGHHPSFVTYALKQFGTREAVALFGRLGLELTAVEDGRMFPMPLHAATVSAFLQEACEAAKIRFVLGNEVTSIQKEGSGYLLRHGGGEERFDAVVIASGSEAMPSLGSSRSGYRFAKALGHRVFETFPVLVQLLSDDPLCKKASGVKWVCGVRVQVAGERVAEREGDLLFTNYGLSGLAVLDISRSVSVALHRGEEVVIVIDMLPGRSLASLKQSLQKRAKTFSDKPATFLLGGMLHPKLVAIVLARAGVDPGAHAGTKVLQRIAYTIKNFEVSIHATRGAKGAEVMAGGVDCSQVDPKTMMSKLHEGLFFTGEVLDIDGDRGGYNLHWAWASGYLAGRKLSLG